MNQINLFIECIRLSSLGSLLSQFQLYLYGNLFEFSKKMYCYGLIIFKTYYVTHWYNNLNLSLYTLMGREHGRSLALAREILLGAQYYKMWRF